MTQSNLTGSISFFSLTFLFVLLSSCGSGTSTSRNIPDSDSSKTTIDTPIIPLVDTMPNATLELVNILQNNEDCSLEFKLTNLTEKNIDSLEVNIILNNKNEVPIWGKESVVFRNISSHGIDTTSKTYSNFKLSSIGEIKATNFYWTIEGKRIYLSVSSIELKPNKFGIKLRS